MEGRETDPEVIIALDIVDNENEGGENGNEPDEGGRLVPEEPTGEFPDGFDDGTFEGAEIQVQAFNADANGNLQPSSDIVAATIIEDFEFTELDVSDDGFFNGFVDFNVDVDITSGGEGSIFVESDVQGSVTFSSFGGDDFSGYVFTFLSEDLPAIENVTIDESLNTFGLEPSDIRFSDNSVSVNFGRITPVGSVAELEFIELGDTFRLDIDFADI